MDYDLFISHASEDKATLVRPLASALAAFGVRLWYDEFTLEVGDSLSRSIDRGLAESRFGIVVLSHAFLRRPWPEYELRGLTAKELGRHKVIVPLWLGVTREDILAFSPPLADRLAIDAGRASIDEIAAEILRVVRPDRHAQLRRLLLEKNGSEPLTELNPNRIAHGVIRHPELPKMLLSRINVVRHVFYTLLPESLEKTVDSFRRDTHPEQEIVVWEAMASTYLDYISEKHPDAAKRKAALALLLHLSASPMPERPLPAWSALDADDLRVLCARWDLYGSRVAPLVVMRPTPR